MSPLPEAIQLPCGWVCERAAEDEIVFAYHGTFEVAATKAGDTAPLSFDLGRRWVLTCREHAGEATNERRLGHATTREAATDTLLSCMERASAAAREGASAASLTLETIVAGADRAGGASPTANRSVTDGGRPRGSH